MATATARRPVGVPASQQQSQPLPGLGGGKRVGDRVPDHGPGNRSTSQWQPTDHPWVHR